MGGAWQGRLCFVNHTGVHEAAPVGAVRAVDDSAGEVEEPVGANELGGESSDMEIGCRGRSG